MSLNKISVIINTKNSSLTIERTLKSVTWADEIVIVDMNSTDNTIEISKKYTDKVFQHEDVGFVEPARNFAISKATHDWIFILDADEEVSKDLKNTIKDLITKDVDIYDIPRKNIVFGKWIKNAGWWPDYQRRLFRKGHVIWSDTIHTVPEIKGSVKKLEPKEGNAIIHHNYQTIEQYIDRLNRYTSIEADQKKDSLISAAKTLQEGFSELQKRLYQHQGYKDVHGIGLSLLQMFYQVAVQLKIWQNQGFKNIDSSIDNTVDTIIKELKYWHASYKISVTKNPITKIYWRIRKKLYI